MNYNINSSGVYDITSYNLISNKATIFSTLNILGSTTLNNTTINSSLNVSGLTILNKTTINNSLYVSGI
jgi:NDP-sugar pyrophosphorylase family protein